MAMTPVEIQIHIDELVLDGVEPHQRAAVAAALRRNLGALVARHGIGTLLSKGAAPSKVTLPPAPAAGVRQTPARLGAQVARALHQGWK